MILTTCAACAAPLAHTAPRCVRCHTRYCDATCQHDHWRRGHKQICKRIHRGGNAEQYNADKKYKEAVAVAVEACAEDTKGQTCYICTQALHWKTKEGLVRGCACRGTAGGFAHVSCLAEQAKILLAEAEENNLGWEVKNPRFERWHTCSLCEQTYHGVVKCALGWACWKTYVGRPGTRPETNQIYGMAMTVLGNGLESARHHEDALSVKEAELSMRRRLGDWEENILAVQGNLAIAYARAGQLEVSRRMQQGQYNGCVQLHGMEHENTLAAATNYAASLLELERYTETKTLMRRTIRISRRVLGEDSRMTLKMRWNYAEALYQDPGANLDDLCKAVATLEETERTARRVFGSSHPETPRVQTALKQAREALAARAASSSSGAK